MQKKKWISFLMICMLSGMITGCQSDENTQEAVIEEEEETIFGLTQSEQKLYAEYAAGILMKYNAGTNMRVLEGQKLIKAEEEAAAALEKEQKQGEQTDKAWENTAQEAENQTSKDTTGTASGEKQYISDMASVMGMDMFSVSYAGYDITDSYPESGEDIFFAMDASNGKRLLVEKFYVTNKSSESQDFDMFSKQGKFKTTVNGKTYKSQYTLLLNDLSMYKGELEAEQTEEMVLIFEIPESVETIDSLELSITAGEKTGTMLLSGNVTNTYTSWENGEEAEEPEEEILLENSPLAEEYMNALEAEENSGILEMEENEEIQEEENVTVVGSRKQ